ncbi:MAG: hypothetical protein NW701_03580 [Nitrospira sp.]
MTAALLWGWIPAGAGMTESAVELQRRAGGLAIQEIISSSALATGPIARPPVMVGHG